MSSYFIRQTCISIAYYAEPSISYDRYHPFIYLSVCPSQSSITEQDKSALWNKMRVY